MYTLSISKLIVNCLLENVHTWPNSLLITVHCLPENACWCINVHACGWVASEVMVSTWISHIRWCLMTRVKSVDIVLVCTGWQCWVVLHCDVIFPPLCGVDVCHLGTGGLGECTFLLVKWWQNTVVLANLEVDFLLNPVRDRSLWNDDTHTCTVMRWDNGTLFSYR